MKIYEHIVQVGRSVPCTMTSVRCGGKTYATSTTPRFSTCPWCGASGQYTAGINTCSSCKATSNYASCDYCGGKQSEPYITCTNYIQRCSICGSSGGTHQVSCGHTGYNGMHD